jgi:hypothetical protein
VKAGGQGTLPADAYAASPSRAASFDKSRLEGQKTQAELAEKKMATLDQGRFALQGAHGDGEGRAELRRGSCSTPCR